MKHSMIRLFADSQLTFLVVVNVLVVVVATVLSRGQFVGIDNLQSMGGQLPELGLLALGIMLSMISGNGGIDLSGVGLANLSGMVAALVAVNDGRASVAVGVTDDLVATLSAVYLVKAAVAALGGQGGGGRPDMAQGGGPDGAKGNDAIAAIRMAIAERTGQ